MTTTESATEDVRASEAIGDEDGGKILIRDSCGSRQCDAGGPPEHNGHLFDLTYEDPEERVSCGMCRCGMDDMTFTLLTVG